MKDWVWIVIACVSAAVVVPLVLASCDALMGCASSPAPVPSPRVLKCDEQYAACVNPDVVTYRACRARVDMVCLAVDGGSDG